MGNHSWAVHPGAPAPTGSERVPSFLEPVSGPQLLAPPAQPCSLTSKLQVAEGMCSSAWHGSGGLWETQAGIRFGRIVAAL